MSVYIVPTDRVGEVWDECAPLLEKAVKLTSGRYTLETVWQDVESGNYQLFVAVDGEKIVGACTTRIAEYPTGIWLSIVHCGGNHLERWLGQGFEAVKAWAHVNKCVGIEIQGRREWKRVLGLNEVSTKMELVL
jgi:hypothetical protein